MNWDKWGIRWYEGGQWFELRKSWMWLIGPAVVVFVILYIDSWL